MAADCEGCRQVGLRRTAVLNGAEGMEVERWFRSDTVFWEEI